MYKNSYIKTRVCVFKLINKLVQFKLQFVVVCWFFFVSLPPINDKRKIFYLLNVSNCTAQAKHKKYRPKDDDINLVSNVSDPYNDQ